MALSYFTQYSLAPHTTLHVGGKADYFVRVTTEGELVEAFAFAEQHNIPVTIIGGGSNILIADAGVEGLVIEMAIKKFEPKIEGEVVTVALGAGELLDEVVERSIVAGWWGIENLSHIPGTVGAMPVQNVGAYGVEAKDIIESVRVFDRASGRMRDLSVDDCRFGYRDSVFKHPEGAQLCVVRVTIRLTAAPQPKLAYKDLAAYFVGRTPELSDIRTAVIAIRAAKFPDWHTVGTAGSFFKNPIITNTHFQRLKETYPALPGYAVDENDVKVSLGWVLEHILNTKGVYEGNVGSYEGQALVFVTRGDATAHEIDAYATKIAERVHHATGIAIEREVRNVGRWN